MHVYIDICVEARSCIHTKYIHTFKHSHAHADALLDLQPRAQLIDLDPDQELENVYGVLESFMVVLVTLGTQEGTMLLLPPPPVPQPTRNHVSIM